MYVGIDCGTQGTKVIILDPETAKVLGEGYAGHELISGGNGRREQHPHWWTAAFVTAYRQALTQSKLSSRAIRAIGVSGQQHGLVALDGKGEIIRPAKLWCDTETAPQNAELVAGLGGESGSMAALGLSLATGYTASKLLWLKQSEPEAFARVRHILLPHDYLNFWLTGELATECGDASGTGYFDIRRRTWAPEVLELIAPGGRLVPALPPILESHQRVGVVRPALARELGLQANVIVSSGGGDNMMGAIGTGNISQGSVTMSLGTSGTVYACAEQGPPPLHPSIAPFCSSSNSWLPLICTMNLTNVANRVRELFGYDLSLFNGKIAESPIGAEGVTLLPFLNGERVPALPDASGSFLGLTMDNLTAGNLCRAALEGTTFGLRFGLDLLAEAGIGRQEIRLIGGGARSPVWRQMVADVVDTTVICPSITESAALGAAIQAIWCTSHEAGDKVSLASLCEQFVALDTASAVAPVRGSVEQYQLAYEQYRVRLTALHGG